MSKSMKMATAVAVASCVAAPAFAQAVGGTALGDPVTFIQGAARAALLAGGAVGTIAGGYKAVQVWTGGRNVYEAATWLVGGLMLFFGTAAVLGFN